MGKYGSGTSMRTVILAETKEVEERLERCGVRDEDRDAIMSAFKEMAYQWCSTNASGCAVEAAMEKLLTEEQRTAILREAIRNGVHEQKMLETFP